MCGKAATGGAKVPEARQMELGQAVTDFIFATNTDGSGKAASCVRALDMLGPILTKHYPNPII